MFLCVFAIADVYNISVSDLKFHIWKICENLCGSARL